MKSRKLRMSIYGSPQVLDPGDSEGVGNTDSSPV